jgi:hypothetical protein
MRYADANEAELGDVVLIDGKHRGTVVAVIDTAAYSEGFPLDQWSYLGKGILVDTEFGGIVHFPGAEEELITLVRRGSAV